LLVRALDRFPKDPPLLLEQAMAAAGRFSVTMDGAKLTLEPSSAVVVNYGRGGPPFGGVPVARRSAQDLAVEQLAALTSDPMVGAEASLRLGYLRWATGDETEGRQALTQAAERTPDPDLRYLARFLLGWIAMAAKDNATAAREFGAALDARPDSQSASLALASIEQQRGDTAQAYERAQATLDKRPTDADPWRLFLYGHHPLLKTRIAAMRAQVRAQ
jgi:tetratricopeptide (TPR) repeat protein